MTDWATINKLVAILAAVIAGMALGGLWRHKDMKEGEQQQSWLWFALGAACGSVVACAVLILGNFVDWRVGDEGLEPLIPPPAYATGVQDTVWLDSTHSVWADSVVGLHGTELDTLGTLEAPEGRYYLVKEVEGE